MRYTIICIIIFTSTFPTDAIARNRLLRDIAVGIVSALIAEKITEPDNSSFHERKHSTHPNVVHTSDDMLVPASGYKWANPNDKNNYKVKWVSGLTHRSDKCLVSVSSEKYWKPKPNCHWTNNGGRESRYRA